MEPYTWQEWVESFGGYLLLLLIMTYYAARGIAWTAEEVIKPIVADNRKFTKEATETMRVIKNDQGELRNGQVEIRDDVREIKRHLIGQNND